MKKLLILKLILLISSCSALRQTDQGVVVDPDKEVLSVLPNWFKEKDQYSLRLYDGGFPIHPFFDASPDIDITKNEINFVLVNHPSDEFLFDLDLVSGEKYSIGPKCEQEDVWGKYGGKVQQMPFAEGVIPNYLTKDNRPWPIIVFGKVKYSRFDSAKFIQRTRVIGGVNLQFCPKDTCRSEDWSNNVIPISVSVEDSYFKKVKNLKELKEAVDWKYVEVYLQNYRGRYLRASQDLPAYRLVAEFSDKSVMGHLGRFAYIINSEKQLQLKNFCHNLYDEITEEITKIRGVKVTRSKSDAEKLEEFSKFLRQSNIIKEEVYEEQEDSFMSGVSPERLFSAWLTNLMEGKRGKDFKTCMNYVRHSSYSFDKKKYWLMTYLELFFKMQHYDFAYSCLAKNWVKVYDKNTQNQIKYLKECSDSKLDLAFPLAMEKIMQLRNSEKPYFLYLSSDLGTGGSKKSIYRWTNYSGKKLRCTDTRGKKLYQAFNKSRGFEYVDSWEKFSDE